MTGPNDIDPGRGALRDTLARPEPPPDLAARVRATLEGRGLVRHPASQRTVWLKRAGLLAAGILIGLFARGASREPTQSARDTRGQYVLLLFGDTEGDTGAVHVAREREYGRWASELSGGTRWVGGHELDDVVADLQPAGAASAPRDERLAGYFVIEAPSRERAAEVARTCPHLKYGGRVVVMAIES